LQLAGSSVSAGAGDGFAMGRGMGLGEVSGKVLVRGTFDLFHSGHVACLREAWQIAGGSGSVMVAVVAAEHQGEKAHLPLEERVFVCQNVKYVTEARPSAGSWDEDIASFSPAAVLINRQDKDCQAAQQACQRAGIQCCVGDRTPLPGLSPRSAESIRLKLANRAGGRERVSEKANQRKRDGAPTPSEGTASVTDRPPWERKDEPVVFVSGCYDLLHSGHIAFFNEAATHGQLFVSIGNDKNIVALKHHEPLFPEAERLALVDSISSVSRAQVCTGSGMLDFEADLDIIKPDIFFVNEDGHRVTKEEACEKRKIRYLVSKRVPSEGLSARSSTALKAELGKEDDEDLLDPVDAFPWRICLAGGWLDQPWVSKHCPGSVIVVNVHPHEQFKKRSGLATSTRDVGMKLWGTRSKASLGPPSQTSPEELAYMLFGAENPPGCAHVAGSQDALGLMLPGVNRLDYNGEYWPENIHKSLDCDLAEWLQSVLWLAPLPSRPDGYDPLVEKNLTPETVRPLAEASAQAWEAILSKDAPRLGQALSDTMKAWRTILPHTVPMPESEEWCKPYREGTHGCLFSGCGGGFLLVISDSPVPNAFQIKIRL